MEDKHLLLVKGGVVISSLLLIDILFFQIKYLSVIFSVLVLALFIYLYIKNNSYFNASPERPFENKGAQVEQEIQTTFLKISNLLIQQTNIVDNEINRANTLIKDAAVGISESFKHLKNLSDDQNSMLNTVIENHRGAVDEEGTTFESFVHDSNETLENFVQVIITTSKQSLEAMSFTDDMSNQLEGIFKLLGQVESLANRGDLLIGISTSGNSKNVINAFKVGREMGCKTLGFSGRDGGAMNEYSDINLIVPSDNTPRIQEMHILFGHTICQLIDDAFDD